jgi:hypothetical protein
MERGHRLPESHRHHGRAYRGLIGACGMVQGHLNTAALARSSIG